MAILDTCAVIHLGKNNKKLLDLLLQLRKNGDKLALSTISVFELSGGMPPGINDTRRKLISPFEIIPFFNNHAEKAGIIFRELKENGNEIGTVDTMLAAVALCENQPIITNNAKHFLRIKGLQVITY